MGSATSIDVFVCLSQCIVLFPPEVELVGMSMPTLIQSDFETISMGVITVLGAHSMSTI